MHDPSKGSNECPFDSEIICKIPRIILGKSNASLFSNILLALFDVNSSLN